MLPYGILTLLGLLTAVPQSFPDLKLAQEAGDRPLNSALPNEDTGLVS